MNGELPQSLAAAPFAASQFADDIDLLFFTMVAVCSIATLAVSCLIVLFCLRYRDGRSTDRRFNQADANWLEYLWIGAPLVIFIGFFFWGAHLYLQYQRLPQEPLVIRTVAKQWMWKFYHPQGQREINTLHLPAGQPVLLRLISEDVIHSFYAPAFRVKQDALPGRYTRLAFTAREPGTYRLFCAEYCGTEHSQMRGVVTIMQPDDYAHWLQQRADAPSLSNAGAKLFQRHNCDTCHGDTDSATAPALIGLAGNAVTLRDGGTATADSAYLREAITLPEKQVVAGYDPIMPSYAGELSEEELYQLVSYIESLRRLETASTQRQRTTP